MNDRGRPLQVKSFIQAIADFMSLQFPATSPRQPRSHHAAQASYTVQNQQKTIMETSELTQIATAHQAAISRHDEEMAEIRAILRQGFARSEQAIAQHNEAIAQRDEAIVRHDQMIAQHNEAIVRHDQMMAQHNEAIVRHDQMMAQHNQAVAQHDREMAAIRAQQQLNAQALAQFTAGLEELRILVADYLRGRENL
jgi:hypothetical protein